MATNKKSQDATSSYGQYQPPPTTVSQFTNRINCYGKTVFFNLALQTAIQQIRAKAESFDDFCLGCNALGLDVVYNGGNHACRVRPRPAAF